MGERWATFDCYGTLVDWNGGIHAELSRLFGDELGEPLLGRYHAVEPLIQAGDRGLSYRAVLARTLERLAAETGVVVPVGELDALGRSLPAWPVFADVRPALEETRRRGWRLAILSNTDRDLLDASLAAIGVPVDDVVVAEELGSYKPAHRHWEVFGERHQPGAGRHVHVAQSLFHDIAPAAELGIPSIWVNRLGEPDDPRPQATLPTLTGLADALDEIAGAALRR